MIIHVPSAVNTVAAPKPVRQLGIGTNGRPLVEHQRSSPYNAIQPFITVNPLVTTAASGSSRSPWPRSRSTSKWRRRLAAGSQRSDARAERIGYCRPAGVAEGATANTVADCTLLPDILHAGGPMITRFDTLALDRPRSNNPSREASA